MKPILKLPKWMLILTANLLLSGTTAFAGDGSLQIDPAVKVAPTVELTAESVNFDRFRISSYSGESSGEEVHISFSPNVYGVTNFGGHNGEHEQFTIKLDPLYNTLNLKMGERSGFTKLTLEQVNELNPILSLTSSNCPMKFTVDSGTLKILRVSPTCRSADEK